MTTATSVGAQDRVRRLTARGALTRDRIVRAAADLMHGAGVAGTTMDQVVYASGTSKSQLCHCFADKDALVAAVIKLQVARVLKFQEPHLERELADRSEPARIRIEAAFRSWESYLAAGLRRMQERGELDAGADPGELATGLMAAYQRGSCSPRQRAARAR